MYLKSIEIQGFKSFANKLLFEFHHGITAIVGPNGSGKSNVADAVRWVLGEQSAKQLRGAKMEDVIFSGTEARKPLGFAYVAITLNNSDHQLATSFEEVTIARRVYRSGESEYLMNGTPCRLKDIQELFMDTGIGKEGYSIIGQGQIDKILSGKPEDRRELFDEAAGIVKFKRRKIIAEKNLESERQNLCRIRDIISEIQHQLTPLEKQSETAKEYLNMRDRLKRLEVNLFLMEYDRIKNELAELEGKERIVEGDLEDTKVQYESTRTEYEELEKKIEELGRQLEYEKNNLNETKISKEQYEGSIKVLKEQIIAAKQNEAHYIERKGQIQKEIEKRNKELEEFQKKKENLQKQLEEKKLSVLEEEELWKQYEREIQEITKQIEHSNKEVFSFFQDKSLLQGKIQHFLAMLEQSKVKKAELNQRILKVKSNEAIFDETIESEAKNLSGLEEQMLGFQNINADIEEKLSLLQIEEEDLKIQHHKAVQANNMEKAKLNSLRNITERYEGYGQSIKRVMEQKDKMNGIIGVVADIIKVEKQYETAIEIALGGSIQNIVTEDEITAKKLIEYLKKNKYGRATFLPLTVMSGQRHFSQMEVLEEQGVIGLASSLIAADKRYQGLVQHLLGRIVVVEHIDNAILLSRKYKNSLRIVTLEGELINPGGSMSGGAFKNSSNLLSRRREMEEIERGIKLLQSEIQEYEKKLTDIFQMRKQKQEKYQENQKNLHELSIRQNTAKLKWEQANADKQSLTIEYQSIHKEAGELDNQSLEWKNAILQLEDKQRILEEQRNLKEIELKNLTKQLEETNGLERKQREKVSSYQLEYKTAEQTKVFQQENELRTLRDVEKLEAELAALSESREDSRGQVESKQNEIDEIQTGILNFENRLKEIQRKIEGLSVQKETISNTHKGFFARREELSGRIIELERETARLGSQGEKLRDQLNQEKNYMWEEYELTFHLAYQLKQEIEYSLPQIKKNISEIKSSIRSLGEVNVNAIEDFKNLEERYVLLKSQHDDLVESEEVLLNIIEELDEEMRKQFKEKFNEIRLEFDKTFKELFGGGKGTLDLMEDEDVLEAGIRIIAQPPGKKLQNMMQLSGGEKALTAIALLFAIQNLKPSPFCLLDEIEAALDDSNVGRYANYLHKLTRNTQFIVITHRRGTMAAADILYGITMQEKGVSTLVSVNLIEDELEK
ncbi:chromosome segregation protein SMC [Anaeromicropila populeti]|uniref:Chromosome partition protein Smc n=1 Tax=Anaeromicropila populeti TaxID=37658 RepID=A0A1I6KFY2_9FIRM|nr:chromosome segregation protein SMC [Anaeromicropila populeti]SFR90155.1 condensin subunit Smc [Anaeromicropila populeti]